MSVKRKTNCWNRITIVNSGKAKRFSTVGIFETRKHPDRDSFLSGCLYKMREFLNFLSNRENFAKFTIVFRREPVTITFVVRDMFLHNK